MKNEYLRAVDIPISARVSRDSNLSDFLLTFSYVCVDEVSICVLKYERVEDTNSLY